VKLSKNFSLHELTKSDHAIRNDIDNTPTMQVIENLQDLVDNVLQPIRNEFGPVVITSGYRSPKLNTAIGGSATSDHCLGYAADFEVLNMDNRKLALWIHERLKFKQLILEFYKKGVPDSGWVHCSFAKEALDGKVMTAARINGRTHYGNGIA
jgi:zinc D-Ala-D-Ala carboxypeptidase